MTYVDLITIAYYSGFVTVMVLLPLACLLDIRYREVSNWLWMVMLIPNIPTLYLLYSNGLPLTYLALSAGLVGLYFLLWGKNLIGGADAKILAAIAVVVPITPFSYVPFQIIFYEWLAVILCVLPVALYIRNWLDTDRLIISESGSLKHMLTYYPRGIPYMVPISVAFLAAIVGGPIL